jgi:serine/threonine protein phosphatase PrpC
MKKWFITGAKRVGFQHENKEPKIPCQDYFAIKGNKNLYAAALSDGLGSATYSEEGAEITTKVCTKLLISNFQKYFSLKSPSEMIDEMIDEINRSIKEVASAKDNKVEDYAATLMFALVEKDNFILGHLGDGAIGSVNLKGETMVISTEEKTQEKNYTTSVTSKNANKNCRIFKSNLKDKIGFVLMSDGPYDVFIQNLPNDKKRMVSDVSDLFNTFKSNLDEFENFLHSYIEENIYPNIHDDISLVFLLNLEFESEFNSLSLTEKLALLEEFENKELTKNDELLAAINEVFESLKWPILKVEFYEALKNSVKEKTLKQALDILFKKEYIIIDESEIIELNIKKSKVVHILDKKA